MTEQKRTEEDVAREAAPFLLELIRKYPYRAVVAKPENVAERSIAEDVA